MPDGSGEVARHHADRYKFLMTDLPLTNRLGFDTLPNA